MPELNLMRLVTTITNAAMYHEDEQHDVDEMLEGTNHSWDHVETYVAVDYTFGHKRWSHR